MQTLTKRAYNVAKVDECGVEIIQLHPPLTIDQANEVREQMQRAFTMNYYVGTDAILVREDSDLTFETAEDIAGHKIGVQAGTIHEAWVQENLVDTGKIDEADVSRYERAELAIADLKNGRVDVVAMDYFAAKAYIEQGGIKLALEQNLSGENMAIAVREGAEGLQWNR